MISPSLPCGGSSGLWPPDPDRLRALVNPWRSTYFQNIRAFRQFFGLPTLASIAWLQQPL